MEASRGAPGRRGGGSCHRRHLPPDTAPQPALFSMTGPGGHGRPWASGHQCSQCVLGNKWPRRLPVLLRVPDRSSTRAGGGLLVTIESVCQSRQVGKPRPEGTLMSQTHRQQGPRSLPRRASPSPSSAPCPGMAVRLSAPARLAPPSAAETVGASGEHRCIWLPGSQLEGAASSSCRGLLSGVTPVAWGREPSPPSQRELSGVSKYICGEKEDRSPRMGRRPHAAPGPLSVPRWGDGQRREAGPGGGAARGRGDCAQRPEGPLLGLPCPSSGKASSRPLWPPAPQSHSLIGWPRGRHLPTAAPRRVQGPRGFSRLQ